MKDKAHGPRIKSSKWTCRPSFDWGALPSCPGRFSTPQWIQNARAIGGGVDDKKCVVFDSPIQQHRTVCFVLLNRYKQDALTLLKGSFSFGVRQTMKKARKKRALKVNV